MGEAVCRDCLYKEWDGDRYMRGRPHCPYCKWKHVIYAYPLSKYTVVGIAETIEIKQFSAPAEHLREWYEEDD